MADNTVEIAVRLALEQFQQAARQLVTTFDGAMSRVEAESAVAGGALDEAFRVLGTKSVAQVEQEVKKLQVALGVIRNMPGVLPADAERATAAFDQRLKDLRGDLDGIRPAAAGAAGSIDRTAASIGNAAKQAAAWAAALVGINSVADLAKNVIETGSAFEQLEGRLKTLLGSQEAAADAFRQIKNLAATTPFEVNALTEAYAKLTAFGLEPTMDQMRAFADTAASMGGGTQMLERVTLALGQAWTKGKLQGQEIMQLAEAGVPVWDLLARATGKNVVELQKMSEAGQLGKSVIKQLIDEMGRVNAGASATLMDTFAGAVSNAKDATAEFFDLIAKSGVLDYLTQQIQSLLVEFDRMKQTGELEQKAQALADGFLNFAEAVKTAFEVVQSLSGVIKLALEAFAVQKVLAFAGALRGVAAAATVARVEMVAVGATAAAAGTAAGTAAIGVGRLATAIRALKTLTVVGLVEGVVSLGAEFFRARRAAEEGDAAVRKMLEPKPAPVRDQVREFNAELDAGRVKLTEWQAEFKRLQVEGRTTGEALKEMLGKAQVVDMKGVTDLLNGLDSVRLAAQATALEIETGLAQKLATMTATQLRDFGVMAQTAFNQGEISARMLATALNESVDASLAKLGITAETSLGGMTAKFVETQQHALLVAEGFDRINVAGMDAGQVLREALDATLKAATSKQDMDALAASVRALGEEGKLAQRDVVEMLDAIARKAEDATPAIDSVGEALRRLGVKSQAELQKVADSFKEAWTEVERGNATLREKQEAFRAYARAAIEANDGVASSFIKARAESLGLTVEIDGAGKATVRLKQEAEGLHRGFDRARESARGLAADTARAAKAAQAAASADGSMPVNKGGAATMSVSVKDFAQKLGLAGDALRDFEAGFSDVVNGVYADMNRVIDPGGTDPFGIYKASGLTSISASGAGNPIVEAQREIERRLRELADRAQRDADNRNYARDRAPMTPINLTLPGLQSPLPLYANQSDASRLVEQLRSAGAVRNR